MPADKARYGVFDALSDKSESDVRTLLEELSKTSPAAGSVQRKVVDFYNSWMDEAAIESRGIEPLQGGYRRDQRRQDQGRHHQADRQHRLCGPDRHVHLSGSCRSDEVHRRRHVRPAWGCRIATTTLTRATVSTPIAAAYKTYVTKIFELVGDPTAAASADAVIALETKLATVHWSPERQRDVQATNNPVDRAGLKKMIPAVDWDAMLPVGGLGGVQHFVVNETTALRDGSKLLDTAPVATWKKYLVFHLASDYASYLPKAFDEASFDFFSKALRGTESPARPLEARRRAARRADRRRCRRTLRGEIFSARDTKPRWTQLVANLRTAMGERLKTLSWMDDKTRAEAQKKLSTFDPRIGYPSKWRDYSALSIDGGKLFENVRNGRKFDWNRQVARLNQPVDRTEWGMNPQEVNAYYNPLMNQITFPAAILQPPFFDPNADPAVNYGAIGAVIGHEMGHGFDDQGREFDETGQDSQLVDARNQQEISRSDQAAFRAVQAFCPLEGVCVNGDLTMGENIGDLGGLEMAYTAYKLSLNGKEAPVIDGFTGDQRFFMAHAQVWRGIQRDDSLRNQVLTNPHCTRSGSRFYPRTKHGRLV